MKRTKAAKAVFLPTREQRNRVEELVAADLDLPLIAEDLGISKTTLKSHFPDELKHGRAYVRKRALTSLFKQAFKNESIPALKAVISLTTDSHAPNAPKDADQKTAVLRLGKKQAQKMEAEAANKGLYATPEPPKVSNKILQ